MVHIKSPAAGATTYDAPPECRNWRLYGMAMSASFASMMFGYDSAFVGSAIKLPSFEAAYGLNTSTVTFLSSNIVSTFQAGCFFGALFIGLINSRFGRRLSLLVAGLVFIVGVIVQIACKGNLGAMYAGRALTGLGVGSSSLIVPNYIAECSIPALRGSLVGGFEMYLQTGLVVGFWINYGVKLHVSSEGDKQWLIPFAVQLIPASMLVVAMAFQKESPRWLVEKGREEEARKVLVYLRNLPADHPYIEFEIDSIRASIQAAEYSHHGHKLTYFDKVKTCFDSKHRCRLFLAVALMWLQNLSGINAMNYFSSDIVQDIGFTGNTLSLLATGIYGIIKAAATFVFMLLIVDRFGRRVPLITGCIGAAAALYYLGIYSIVAKTFDSVTTGAHQDGAAKFALACIYIFSIFYAFSLNGIPWIFQSEVFELAVRSPSMTIAVMNQWLSQFVIVYSAPYMIANIKGWTFIFFAIWCSICVPFFYFFFPETKGVPLEAMETFWDGPTFAPRRRKRYEEIVAASAASHVPEYRTDAAEAAAAEEQNLGQHSPNSTTSLEKKGNEIVLEQA